VDAAGRIDEDPVALFGEAASLARPEMADDMRAFLKRDDLADILAAMRYAPREEPAGFRYEYLGGPVVGLRGKDDPT
jgi:hypothetical protein